ncbi:unnamed protein product [Fraxinus pennsylvanica]|uniref:Uncharacterized protein n=1 Tax=Fraxinus pennsylvanica TaxID=56036 RepID=A0AAD1Z918_9LAMI|nr:unnamed protein product [Fraxinus pennsylvanica]
MKELRRSTTLRHQGLLRSQQTTVSRSCSQRQLMPTTPHSMPNILADSSSQDHPNHGRQTTNNHPHQNLQARSRNRDMFPHSPRKGWTHTLRDRKFRDRLSPLGTHGNAHDVANENSVPKVQEQQSSKPPLKSRMLRMVKK